MILLIMRYLPHVQSGATQWPQPTFAKLMHASTKSCIILLYIIKAVLYYREHE